MDGVIDALVGDGRGAALAALKALVLFLTAVALFRITERRTLAELAPFDFVTAVAVGAIVGRTATAADTSFLTGAAALVTLLIAYAVVSRLRFLPGMARLVDPPVRTLIRDGQVQRANLRRCGLRCCAPATSRRIPAVSARRR